VTLALAGSGIAAGVFVYPQQATRRLRVPAAGDPQRPRPRLRRLHGRPRVHGPM